MAGKTCLQLKRPTYNLSAFRYLVMKFDQRKMKARVVRISPGKTSTIPFSLAFSPQPGTFSQTSIAESSYESSTQLLFLLHIWLSGGRMYLTAMVSSTLVIGKVGAENILTNGQENKLQDKSFLEKVFLIARYMPVIALTAIFRIGCASTVLYHPDHFVPITPAFAVFLTWVYCMCSITLLLIILSILKIWISMLSRDGKSVKNSTDE